MRNKETTEVRKVNCRRELEAMDDAEIEEVVQQIKIMRLQKAGRYSGSRKAHHKTAVGDASPNTPTIAVPCGVMFATTVEEKVFTSLHFTLTGLWRELSFKG